MSWICTAVAHRNIILGFIVVCSSFGFTYSQNTPKDSECYTPNGRDYEGTQSVTYVRGTKSYEPDKVTSEACLPWTSVRGYMNVTDFNKQLPNNYCRNPNNKLFPYCYVRRNGQPAFAYCHIPTCNTPALLGCFKLTVKEIGEAPSAPNSTDIVILSGTASMDNDPQMKIGRCLNYCRSRGNDYAGVTGGNSCLCGSKYDDGPFLKEKQNILHPEKCLQYPCADDRLQACGGDDAIAIYDVEAGSCTPTPIHQKDSGIIYSPRWPGKYHNEAKCRWTIYIPDKYLKDEETRNNYQLRLHFTYFRIEKGNDTLQLYQYVNSSFVKSHSSYSGFYDNGMPPIYFEAADTVAVHMIFTTDKDHKHEGFIMKYDVMYTGPPTSAISTTTKAKATTTSAAKPITSSPTKPTMKVTTTLKPKTSVVASASPTQQTNNSTIVGKSVKQEASSSLGGGAVAGVVIGVLIFVILCVVAAVYVRKHLWVEKSSETTTFNNPVSFNSDTPL